MAESSQHGSFVFDLQFMWTPHLVFVTMMVQECTGGTCVLMCDINIVHKFARTCYAHKQCIGGYSLGTFSINTDHFVTRIGSKQEQANINNSL